MIPLAERAAEAKRRESDTKGGRIGFWLLYRVGRGRQEGERMGTLKARKKTGTARIKERSVAPLFADLLVIQWPAISMLRVDSVIKKI
jgi:hypothetical protein